MGFHSLHQERVSFLHPHSILIFDPSGKAILPSNIRCSQWLQSKAMHLSFLEIYHYLLKTAEVVKAGGSGGSMQGVQGCWLSFPIRSHIYLDILLTWRKETSLVSHGALMISYLAPSSDLTQYIQISKKQLTDGPSVNLGDPPWLTV